MSQNPAGGAPQWIQCPSCHKTSPGEARFCKHCGAKLTSSPSPVQPPPAPAPPTLPLESGRLPDGEFVAGPDGRDLFLIRLLRRQGGGAGGDTRTYEAELLPQRAPVLLHEAVAPALLPALTRLKTSAALQHVARIDPAVQVKPFGSVERLFVAEAAPPSVPPASVIAASSAAVRQAAQQLARGLAELHEKGRVAFNLSPERPWDHVAMLAGGGAQWCDLRELVLLQEVPDAQFADVRALAAWLGLPLAGMKTELDAIANGSHRATAADLARLLDATQPVPAAEAVQPHPPQPQSAHPVRIDLGYATDTGAQRTGNEDSYGLIHLAECSNNEPGLTLLLAVADGMGGEEAGEVASRLAIRSLIGSAVETVAAGMPNAAEWVQQATRRANDLVVSEARKRGNQMGATLVFALVRDRSAYLGNVGDARIYRWNPRRDDGQIVRLVKDHSLVQQLVDAGRIKDEERYSHPERNMVVRSIGDTRTGRSDDNPPVAIQAGDWLVLCSDGLWEMVRDSTLRDILAQSSTAQLACDRLVAEANRNGGEDNITVVIGRFL